MMKSHHEVARTSRRTKVGIEVKVSNNQYGNSTTTNFGKSENYEVKILKRMREFAFVETGL